MNHSCQLQGEEAVTSCGAVWIVFLCRFPHLLLLVDCAVGSLRAEQTWIAFPVFCDVKLYMNVIRRSSTSHVIHGLLVKKTHDNSDSAAADVHLHFFLEMKEVGSPVTGSTPCGGTTATTFRAVTRTMADA
jgi:hypothetical protein